MAFKFRKWRKKDAEHQGMGPSLQIVLSASCSPAWLAEIAALLKTESSLRPIQRSVGHISSQLNLTHGFAYAAAL